MENENQVDPHPHPYDALGPDRIIRAVESMGFICDGTLVALNSYENRVYQVGIEDEKPIIAKFYRPGRWTRLSILEEHAFCMQLAEHEIPFVTPILAEQGSSLHHFEGFQFALYPRCGGRWPDLDQPGRLRWMGRLVGRMHGVGRMHRFAYRPVLDVDTFGVQSYRYLLDYQLLPMEFETPYRVVAERVVESINQLLEQLGEVSHLRLHGDCHPGNILWTDEGPHFVDLDDCRTGPAIQDLWMLLSGSRDEMALQLSEILAGYTQFHTFDAKELRLIEPMRALRLMHYSAWLARRWEDPAFPKNFPWFNSNDYWREQILVLEEQCLLIDQPPLPWLVT